MADTGWLLPVSALNVSAPGQQGVAWSNVTNILASDDSHATNPSNAFLLIVGLFSANIPAGSTVQGFEVRYERRHAINDPGVDTRSEKYLRFVSAKTPAGRELLGVSGMSNSAAPAWSTVDVIVTAGSPTNMWGMTTADASAGRVGGPYFGFGVAVSARWDVSANARIDMLGLKITFTSAASEASTDVFSSEHVFEIDSVSLSKNIVIQSSEYDHEVQSVDITQIHVVGAQSSEYDHEINNVGGSLNITVGSGELDHEIHSVSLSNNIVIQSSEYDHELCSVAFTITYIVNPFSSEYDHELDSVALTQIHVVGAQSSEHEHENQSAALSVNFVVQSSEYEHEIMSANFTQTHVVGVESSEYGREITSVNLSNLFSLSPVNIDIGHEIKSVALIQTHNIIVTSVELDHELYSVDLSQRHSVGVISSEYGCELDSGSLRYFKHGNTPPDRTRTKREIFTYGGYGN